MSRLIPAIVALVTVVSLLLSACAPAATPTPTPAPAKPTAAPAAAPTAAPKPAATAPAAAPTAAKPAGEATKPAAAPTAPAKPAATPAAAANVSSAKMDQWYEAAKKEGEVIWAQGEDPGKLQTLFDSFQKRYPGVKVTLVMVPVANLASRAITEAQAKRLTFDAGSGGSNVVSAAMERSLLERLDLEGTGADPQFLDPGGYGVFVKETLLGLHYNKNLVNEKTDLTKWEDLLNPKWMGKIAVQRNGAGFEGLASVFGEEKTVAFLKELIKNKPIGVTSPQDGMLRLARGEVAFYSASANQGVFNWSDGAPIAPAALGPWYSSPQHLFVFKDVPHPNAARLFVAYMATPEGRQGLEAAEWGSYVPCGTSSVNKMLCGVPIKLYRVDNLEGLNEIARLRTVFSKVFESIN